MGNATKSRGSKVSPGVLFVLVVAIGAAFGLTIDQLNKILVEGIEKKWLLKRRAMRGT